MACQSCPVLNVYWLYKWTQLALLFAIMSTSTTLQRKAIRKLDLSPASGTSMNVQLIQNLTATEIYFFWGLKYVPHCRNTRELEEIEESMLLNVVIKLCSLIMILICSDLVFIFIL